MRIYRCTQLEKREQSAHGRDRTPNPAVEMGPLAAQPSLPPGSKNATPCQIRASRKGSLARRCTTAKGSRGFALTSYGLVDRISGLYSMTMGHVQQHVSYCVAREKFCGSAIVKSGFFVSRVAIQSQFSTQRSGIGLGIRS